MYAKYPKCLRCVALQAKLLEHNVRFGDPECQGLMARLDSDLVEALVKVGVYFCTTSLVTRSSDKH